jgi:hypothetical protein
MPYCRRCSAEIATANLLDIVLGDCAAVGVDSKDNGCELQR